MARGLSVAHLNVRCVSSSLITGFLMSATSIVTYRESDRWAHLIGGSWVILEAITRPVAVWAAARSQLGRVSTMDLTADEAVKEYIFDHHKTTTVEAVAEKYSLAAPRAKALWDEATSLRYVP